MKTSRKLGQDGVASILITMVMMVVITLIVIGFAQVARRNQRVSLDRQLSTQAYYAAETGVNDAIKKLQADPSLLATTGACNSGNSFISLAGLSGSQILNDSNDVKYTCVTVSGTPATLTSSEIKVNDSWSVPVTPSGSTGGLTISWKANETICPDETVSFGHPSTCPPGHTKISDCTAESSGYDFKPVSGPYANYSCGYGLLRLDLYQYTPGSSGSGGVSASNQAEGLDANVATLYILPVDSASTLTTSSLAVRHSGGSPFTAAYNPTITFGTKHAGYIMHAPCTVSQCSITIHASPDFGVGGTAYYARVGSYYKPGESVTIGSASGGVSFSGGQAVIDVTGKASDQLRRIQVRVPLSSSTASTDPVPNFGFSSTLSVCKDPSDVGIIAGSACNSLGSGSFSR